MSQKVTVKIPSGPVTYEVFDSAQFMDRPVKLGITPIGSVYECLTSDSDVQKFVVAALLHKIMGGEISHWCELCRCRVRKEEMGIWN